MLEWLSVWKRKGDLARLRDVVSPSAEIRLLDVGGGAGAATEQYATGCRAIVVIDPDPRKVALGRMLRPSMRFEQARGESMPFRNATFDRVVAVVAFHHMEDQRRVLQEMHRVLRPGGALAFLELEPSRSPGWLGRRIFGHRHGGEMTFLAPDDLKILLESAGFGGIAWESGGRCYLMTATKTD